MAADSRKLRRAGTDVRLSLQFDLPLQSLYRIFNSPYNSGSIIIPLQNQNIEKRRDVHRRRAMISFKLPVMEGQRMEITLTDFATLLLALVTAISLFYISRQVNITRQQTKGQFLL